MPKRWIVLSVIVLLAGCPSAYIDGVPNERSPYFQLPVGSELILEKEVAVPAGDDQLYFQNGRTMDWRRVDIYRPHCALKVDSKMDADRSIHPDRFTLTQSSTERFFRRVHSPGPHPGVRMAGFDPAITPAADFDRDGRMDYEVTAVVMELRSARQPQVREMICADWGLPQDRLHITVQNIRRALGDFFTIQLPDR
jgi:hypothetical protein